jgi:Polysaccharide lyase
MRILTHAGAAFVLVLALGGFAVAAGKPAALRTKLPSPPKFVGDFETGNTNQWTWGAQCANTGVPSTSTALRGTITIQSATVGQGNYAAQFDLPTSPEVRNACETVAKRKIGVGTDDYYGLMVRLPSDWQEPSGAGWGLVLAQFNFEGLSGPPLALVAHANDISVVLQSGQCVPSCQYTSSTGGNIKPMIVTPAYVNVWHEFIVHVRWAANSKGVIEVWHRLKLHKLWRKMVDRRGFPTLQWDAQGSGSLLGNLTSDKIGAYRGWARFPTTVWLDGFIRSSSFQTTAAALP